MMRKNRVVKVRAYILSTYLYFYFSVLEIHRVFLFASVLTLPSVRTYKLLGQLDVEYLMVRDSDPRT